MMDCCWLLVIWLHQLTTFSNLVSCWRLLAHSRNLRTLRTLRTLSNLCFLYLLQENFNIKNFSGSVWFMDGETQRLEIVYFYNDFFVV